MKDSLKGGVTEKSENTRELSAALRSALDRKYTRFVQSTRALWEQRFGTSDPSDACVSVRISGAPARQLRKAA